MKNMRQINMSRKAFEKLERMALPKEVLNTESKIYEYTFRGETKILKYFYVNKGEYFANKMYTVEMLDNYKDYLPDSFVIPDYMVAISNRTIGFTVPKVDGIPLICILSNPKMDKQDQLDYLKKVGGILNQLKGIRKYTSLKDIYINDVNESNFIVKQNNRELKVIDLDSAKIQNNRIFPAKYLQNSKLLSNQPNKYKLNLEALKEQNIKYATNYPKFHEGLFISSEETDNFCYTIMILNYLYGGNVARFSIEEYFTYLDYLDSIGLPKELIKQFESILTERHTDNPVGYLDELTSENIIRARNNIYKITRGKVLSKKI